VVSFLIWNIMEGDTPHMLSMGMRHHMNSWSGASGIFVPVMGTQASEMASLTLSLLVLFPAPAARA